MGDAVLRRSWGLQKVPGLQIDTLGEEESSETWILCVIKLNVLKQKLNAFSLLPLKTGTCMPGKGRAAGGTLDIVVMAAVTDTSVAFPPGSLTGFTSSRMVLYCTLERRKSTQWKTTFFFFKAFNWGYATGMLFWPNICHLRVLLMVHLLLLGFDDPSQEALGLNMRSENPNPNNTRMFSPFYDSGK